MKKAGIIILPFLITIISFSQSAGQQLPDTVYKFPVRQAAYQEGKGPVVLIDEAHYNFHTKGGNFFAFSRLLEQDGYQVKSLDKTIENKDILKACKILVIANALDPSDTGEWVVPNPSAFSGKEISNLKEWVENGGSLLLIADHMPFAGAASQLGKAFGFEFINGFAITGEHTWPPTIFSANHGTLADSPVTRGLKDYEKIDSVTTFTGSAFMAPKTATSLFRFRAGDYSLMPDTAWRFTKNTPRKSLDGFSQGAILDYGKGKVAVFGEAAMFTAQVVNGSMKVGFNSETAPQNAQFVLNLIHWLGGVEKYNGTPPKEKKIKIKTDQD